jgi:hypothetical protein
MVEFYRGCPWSLAFGDQGDYAAYWNTGILEYFLSNFEGCKTVFL